jgi:hypothetical protein
VSVDDTTKSSDRDTGAPRPVATHRERFICHSCGQRAWVDAGQERTCAECGGYLRHFGPLEGLVDRFFAPADQVDSQLYRRHIQMIEALWTRDNRGREYYDILRPRLSYSRFEKMVTELICRGLEEGWAELRLPRAPIPDDDAYCLTFVDTDRFVAEMTRLFEPMNRDRRCVS